jgi:hypothetical protein
MDQNKKKINGDTTSILITNLDYLDYLFFWTDFNHQSSSP